MNIVEAIEATTKEQPYITRESWGYPTDRPVPASVYVLPTNSPDCCIIKSSTNKEPRRGWQPTAGDLTANDWHPVG